MRNLLTFRWIGSVVLTVLVVSCGGGGGGGSAPSLLPRVTADSCSADQIFENGRCRAPRSVDLSGTNECEAAGWTAVYHVDSEKRVGERCQIRWAVVDTAASFSGGDLSLLLIQAGQSGDYCISRKQNNYDPGGVPECRDSNLFGELGFPQKPEGYISVVENHRLTVRLVPDGRNAVVFNNKEVQPMVNAFDCSADQIFANGQCRARVATDCTGLIPILDNNQCRARVAADCTGATPVLGDDGQCRARVATDCTGLTPILDNNQCRAIVAIDCPVATPVLGDDGQCRARVATDCTGLTPIFDNNQCRAIVAADCAGNTPIFANGQCRARVATDCTGLTPIFANNQCRAIVAADCAGDTPIFANGQCRARVATDCTGLTPVFANNQCRAIVAADCAGDTPIFANGQCRARVATDCTGLTPVFDNNQCRAIVAADCAGNTPIFANGQCRARVATDCTGLTPIFDNNQCRAIVAADCAGNAPIFDNGQCRARVATDCTGLTPIFDNNQCRAIVAADCAGNTPIFENGQCRVATASDCSTAQIFDNGQCRARVAADCPVATPVLGGDGQCRTRVATDCAGNTPIFENGQCRVATASDCSTAQIFDNGQCRARVAADCPVATPVLGGDGQCRTRVATDCAGNTPIFANGQCRARVATDCTGNTPVLDNGECFATVVTSGTTVAVRSDGNFAYAEIPPPNPQIETPLSFRTREFRRQYGLNLIRAEHAYARGYFGQGVTVAVVDSGVVTSHVDLDDNLVPGYRFTGRTAYVTTDITDLVSRGGHGTPVAGIIAAERGGPGAGTYSNWMHGVAPQAKILPIQTAGYKNGKVKLIADARNAINLALDHDVQIINNSYGRSFQVTGHYNVPGTDFRAFGSVDMPLMAPFWNEDHRSFTSDLANIVADHDTVLVWAAGNTEWNRSGGRKQVCLYGDFAESCFPDPNHPDLQSSPRIVVSPSDIVENFVSNEYGALNTLRVTVNGLTLGVEGSGTGLYEIMPVYYPQLTDQWLVAVAITSDSLTNWSDPSEVYIEQSLWPSSNGCGRAKFWCLGAPGTLIDSTGHPYRPGAEPYTSRLSGTSFAAPHVSGALALLKSRLPDMPMSVARALLLVSASDMGEPGVDDEYGWGLVNLERAITLQGRFALTDPVYPPAQQPSPPDSPVIQYSAQELTITAVTNLPVNPMTATPESFDTGQFQAQYGLGGIGAEHAYARGYFGQGVTVAVVDTGALTTHQDLRNNYIQGNNYIPGSHSVPVSLARRIDENINSAYNPFGHGTAVAGVIAAQMNTTFGTHGVAPQAKILPVQEAALPDILDPDPAVREPDPPETYEALYKSSHQHKANIFISSAHFVRHVVGGYGGTLYSATVPEVYNYPFEEIFNLPIEELYRDTMVVFPTGDQGWHEGSQGVQLCSDVLAGLRPDRDCPEESKINVSPEDLLDGNFIPVAYQNDHGFFREGTNIRVTLANDQSVVSVRFRVSTSADPITFSVNHAGHFAREPIRDSGLVSSIHQDWLAVAALNQDMDDLASFSNGCGDAKFWCISAPGENIYTADGRADDSYGTYSGTAFAAAHAAGALALLKSRVGRGTRGEPDVSRAILLASADDLGEEGIDGKFGWGRINLERAITLQALQEIVYTYEPPGLPDDSESLRSNSGTSGSESQSLRSNSGTSDSEFQSRDDSFQGDNAPRTESNRGALLTETNINLPAALAGVKDKLNNVSVAVSAFNGAHYNIRLGDLAQVESGSETSRSNLGEAAAGMLAAPVRETSAGAFFAGVDDDTFRHVGVRGSLPDGFGWQDGGFRIQHNFCEHCKPGVWQEWEMQEWNNEGAPALPFFAREESNSFLLQMTGDGIRPFASIGGELHTRGDAPYQQLGLRWQASGGGNDDDDIGDNDVWSAVLEVSHIQEDETFLGADFGALGEASAETMQGRIVLRSGWGDWRVFGTYEQAASQVEIDAGALLEGVDGLEARGWKAGIEKSHVWNGGDRLRFSIGEETLLRGGKAVIRHAVAGCSDGTEGDCFSEAIFGKVEGAPDIYKEREQVLTPARSEVSLSAAVRPTFSLGYTTPLGSIGGLKLGSGSHLSLGAEHNPQDGETALSAQLQVQF